MTTTPTITDAELKQYFRDLGSRGGKSTSKKKRKAARTNLYKARATRWANRKMEAKKRREANQ
jgi:hypothetical protein